MSNGYTKICDMRKNMVKVTSSTTCANRKEEVADGTGGCIADS